MSAYDPPSDGEGRLDPLGLAPLSDRIADTYARPVRARMRRVRFLTVISLGALVVEALEGVEPKVPGDSAELAFERLVVEAIARNPDKDSPIDTGVPGITKAHQAIIEKQRLDARGYLKSPRVFGFHGVYRPLALSLGLVDSRGGLLPPGRVLVEALEQDLNLTGLLERTTNSPGNALLTWLIDETGNALRQGRNTFAPSNQAHLPALIAIASPSGMGIRERREVSAVMRRPIPSLRIADDESFIEALELLAAVAWEPGTTEPEIAAQLLNSAPRGLAARLQAIVAYEDFARDMTWAFDTLRFLSSKTQHGVPDEVALGLADGIAIPATRLASRYGSVLSTLETAASYGVDASMTAAFTDAFAVFGQHHSEQELVDLLVQRHKFVQGNKPPAGKRSWFDPVEAHVSVRPQYAVFDEPQLRTDTFLHPYRFIALCAFLEDLRG